MHDARQRLGGRGVDGEDLRVRVRAAQDRAVQHAGQVDVIDVVALAPDEALVPALRGTDYLVSCVPLYATESQMPLIFAAKEAGVERFVPSEYGAIYEFEQFWQTDTTHRLMARQKAFIRRMIELAGMDYTIIPAGAWIEYYMLEPVMVMGDPDAKLAWLVILGTIPICVLGLLLRSRFGRALAGIKANEQRMRATGFSTYPYKLAAFVISGAIAEAIGGGGVPAVGGAGGGGLSAA